MKDYGPQLYANLGHGVGASLIIQAGWISWGIIGNSINAVLLDRVGRKWLMGELKITRISSRSSLTRDLVVGMVGCAVSLLLEIVMVALYQDSNNRAGNSAAVFFLFLHIGL